MTSLKSLAAAGALLLGALGTAHATAIRGTWLPQDDAAPGVFVDTWSFDSAAFDRLAAGNDFQDYFIFNPPTDEAISIRVTGDDGIVFDNYRLRVYADFSTVATQPASAPGTISGGPYALTSGTYWLDIFGLVATDGAHYTLTITGTQAEDTPPPPLSTVPEPGSMALLLAGLGGIAAMSRRRRG